MSLEKNLERVVARHHELAQQMASGEKRPAADYARMAKEYADLKPIVEAVGELRGVRQEMADLKALIADKATDAEMKALAEDELAGLKGKLPGLEKRVQAMLLPARISRIAFRASAASAPAARKRRCSPPTCSACTSATPKGGAGSSS